MKLWVSTLLLSLAFAVPVYAACPIVKRSSTVLRHFRESHPCPSTGQTTGACPGWVLDHGVPLCLAGQRGDIEWNIHWQDEANATLKDALEKDLCRKLCPCMK